MKKGDFRKVLAAFFSIVSCAYLTAITFFVIPIDNMGNANTITGFLLGTTIATILGYYFGSSEEANRSAPDNKPEDQIKV